MSPEYHNRQKARQELIGDVMSAACAASDDCRRNVAKAHKIAEIAVDSWEPRFETMSEAEITRELKRSVRRKMRDRSDEFGFVMVITMGMIMTWILQALVVSVIASLVQRWFRDKESMRQAVQ